jgi:hypothetical protein
METPFTQLNLRGIEHEHVCGEYHVAESRHGGSISMIQDPAFLSFPLKIILLVLKK